MSDLDHLIVVLFLLGVANGAPMFAGQILKERLATPLDLGLNLPDEQPIFGRSKTIRGLLISIVCTAAAGALLGVGWRTGAELAALSMLGDLLSSFVKRRLGLPPHSQAFGVDQIPEVLVPVLVLQARLGLTGWDIAVLVAAFVILEIVLSRLLFRLRLRDRPY